MQHFSSEAAEIIMTVFMNCNYNPDDARPVREFARVEDVLRNAQLARVGVFGDFCLDAYWRLGPTGGERSLETGLPMHRVSEQRYCLGGAANVVANVIDLGIRHVKAVGVVGRDLFGGELMRLLRERGADISGIVFDDEWQTMVYAKPYCGEAERSRIDFGAFDTLSERAIDLLLEALELAASACTVVILNQQISPGISTPTVILRVNEVVARHPETQFIVDARNHAALFRDVIYKLNTREASELLGEPSGDSVVPVARAKAYAERIRQKTRRPVFLTRGEQGMLVADGADVHEILGIQIIERTDPVGAGDTVVAALAAVLGSGGDPVVAGSFANLAASVTVRKIQTTGTATPAEILSASHEPDYVYSPELAQDARHARFLEGTEIELVSAIPDGVRIQHAIFDHDGTISTLREGWEQIMVPMMVSAILGPWLADADRGQYSKVLDAVRDFIDKTTGIQTLVQMQGLTQMVRQFGYVPENQILDEHGYKRLYNEQLMAVVRQRIQKLERGELEATDFQIKNAGRLLRHLHARGVKLYLASGTDEGDVRREAEAMGYAAIFEDRIFGAIGDVKAEAKKMVLERILREHRLSGGEFVTFGDGPVEIRETRKRGGICVGVASDEIRRFGPNPAKRTRLIRAGAQLIVPDFSQMLSLLSFLGLYAREERLPARVEGSSPEQHAN